MIPVAAQIAAAEVDVALIETEGGVVRQCRRCGYTDMRPIDPARYVPQRCSRCDGERHG